MKKKRNVVTWWGAKKIENYWHHQSFERWNTIISKTYIALANTSVLLLRKTRCDPFFI